MYAKFGCSKDVNTSLRKRILSCDGITSRDLCITRSSLEIYSLNNKMFYWRFGSTFSLNTAIVKLTPKSRNFDRNFWYVGFYSKSLCIRAQEQVGWGLFGCYLMTIFITLLSYGLSNVYGRHIWSVQPMKSFHLHIFCKAFVRCVCTLRVGCFLSSMTFQCRMRMKPEYGSWIVIWKKGVIFRSTFRVFTSRNRV